MYLADDPRPPLPEWITDAYTVLSDQILDSPIDESRRQIPAISRDQAVRVLCASDRLALEPEDAEYAITRLLERGHLYEVGAELRVTSSSAE